MSGDFRARQERIRRFRLAAICLFVASVALALVAVWTESPNWWGTTVVIALAALICGLAAVP